MLTALSTLDLAQPGWLLMLPLPWLVRRLAPSVEGGEPALRVPWFDQLAKLIGPDRAPARRERPWLALLCWLALVLAAAGPRLAEAPLLPPATGRELMLAVDLSGSMQIEDMVAANGQPISRLEAVKTVLAEFIPRRQGDRMGLILFGSEAHVQAPLTLDYTTVAQFMEEAQLGFAGPETAIGDAIGLAIKRLRQRHGDRHVLILLSDGANNAGQVSPERAAALAARHGIIIHTIGLGADALPGWFGLRQANPSADLDEAALEQIAELTGGRYFRARDPRSLSAIYAELDRLEPIACDGRLMLPLRSIARWPLTLALLLSMAEPLCRLKAGSRQPWLPSCPTSTGCAPTGCGPCCPWRPCGCGWGTGYAAPPAGGPCSPRSCSPICWKFRRAARRTMAGGCWAWAGCWEFWPWRALPGPSSPSRQPATPRPWSSSWTSPPPCWRKTPHPRAWCAPATRCWNSSPASPMRWWGWWPTPAMPTSSVLSPTTTARSATCWRP